MMRTEFDNAMDAISRLIRRNNLLNRLSQSMGDQEQRNQREQ